MMKPREQVAPGLNPITHAHLVAGHSWQDIDWVYHEDIRIQTAVDSHQIIGKNISLSIDDQDQLLDAVIFHQLVGDDETVLQLTSETSIPVSRMGVWCSLQTARADSLRKLRKTEEAAELSLTVVRAYEDYAQAWFVLAVRH